MDATPLRRPLAVTGIIVAAALALMGACAIAAPHADAAAKKPARVKIASAKSAKAGQLTVKVKKAKGAKGYQYKVGTNKKLTKGKKVKASKKRTATFAGLKQGKRYYVKVRAYAKKGKRRVWGRWSAVKSVRVAKRATPAARRPLSYVYVDAGRSSKETTKWDEASQSYRPVRIYELYICDATEAPAAGSPYKGGTVVCVSPEPRGEAYPAGSITLLAARELGCDRHDERCLEPADRVHLPDMGECTDIDLSRLDTSSVTDMGLMFRGCSALASLDVSGWNTSRVDRMPRMFDGCKSLASLDVSGWDTSRVTDMSLMFSDCSSLASLDVSGWDTSCVTDMGLMFFNCSSLASLDVSGWDTSGVTYMNWMFVGCESLASLDVSGWDTSSVTDMDSMFFNCSALASLDVSNFRTAKVKDMCWMFDGCDSLSALKTGAGWNTSNAGVEEGTYKPGFPTWMQDESGAQFSKHDCIPDGAHTYTAVE